MFFTLSKILRYLFYPLSLAPLLFIVFALLQKRRPKPAWRLFWIALAVLYLPSTGPVSDLLLLPLEGTTTQRSVPEDIDAIVVLGGFTDLKCSSAEWVELNEASDRFVQGVLLTKQRPDALLIFSGGSGNLFDQSKREAYYVKRLAMDLGVPEGQIRLDEVSRNTRENAVESKKILESEGATTFVLVTTAYHMKRSLACFRKVGLDPIPYTVDFRNHWRDYDALFFVPQSHLLSYSTHALKEYAGFITYRLMGYI